MLVVRGANKTLRGKDITTNGILFNSAGIVTMLNNKRTPCIMADILDFAPALLFAEVRTTTDVIGKPPKSELIIFPMPWAFSSTLVSV